MPQETGNAEMYAEVNKQTVKGKGIVTPFLQQVMQLFRFYLPD